jgi:hypothetical protein
MNDQQLELIRDADGRMLEDRFYHAFEFSGEKVIVEWRGRATGNKQVYFSSWSGKENDYNLVRDVRDYNGEPIRLTLTAAPGEQAVYLRVNCTNGTIATDQLKVVPPPGLEKRP